MDIGTIFFIPCTISFIIESLSGIIQCSERTKRALFHHMVKAVSLPVIQAGDKSILPGERFQDLVYVFSFVINSAISSVNSSASPMALKILFCLLAKDSAWKRKTSGKYQMFFLAILLILKKNTNSGKQLRTILRWISEAAQAGCLSG